MGLLAALVIVFAAAQAPRATTVIAVEPDPAVVRDPDVRDAIRDVKKPWKIRDEATGVTFVLIPSGVSYVGANDDDPVAAPDEKPRFHVTCTKAFYMAETETTFRQWRSVDGYRGHAVDPLGDLVVDADDQPVSMVSHADAALWCTKSGWRLPDEREWEYAARGRVDALRPTVWPWGDAKDGGAGWGNVPDLAARKLEDGWDVLGFDDGFAVTAPVGKFRANGFGLRDMIGNVSEWCANRFDPKAYVGWSKLRGLRTMPKGFVDAPPKDDAPDLRSARGGSWYPPATACRASHRWGYDASTRLATLGFRAVRDI